MLKDVFVTLLKNHHVPEQTIPGLWDEIEQAYAARGRYYHTLQHLSHLLTELNGCRQLIKSWDAVLFSVFYHDIIYDVKSSSNELNSARLAVTRLRSLHIEESIVQKCERQIMATGTHESTGDVDANYFTDADLSILGQPPDAYMTYKDQIRKEFDIYPSLVYNPGRRKVLNHFLSMTRIYKTDHFFGQYELQARKNLEMEIRSL